MTICIIVLTIYESVHDGFMRPQPELPSLTRRKLLGSIPVVATGVTARVDVGPVDDAYHLTQGDRCVPLEPLSGDQMIATFYDWDEGNTAYSSAGTVDLQRPATSILFLYDGPGGVSLVMVHGQLGGDSPGGSVTFEFEGLPDNGYWAVQDDFYDRPSNFDRWARDGSYAKVDWTWAAARTDGGAFSGLDGVHGLELQITPRFNEAAGLYGQYYDGRVRRWQALSGSLDAPERHDLRLDESVTIHRGVCTAPGVSVSVPLADGSPDAHDDAGRDALVDIDVGDANDAD